MAKSIGKPMLGRTNTIDVEDSFEEDASGAANECSDDDDEEEDVEIKISASGSVLTPSPDPYDKSQKLKHANALLMASKLSQRPPAKVRFNDTVLTAEEAGEGLQHITSVEALKSSPCKILLVTVPTGFSQDVEEFNSDEDILDETDPIIRPTDQVERIEDCGDTAHKLKKAYTDCSVDMKSVDDDYENTVEDLTTTLVSLCRMTSECEDTNLENNISKFEKIDVGPSCEALEPIEENDDGIIDDVVEDNETTEELDNNESGSEEPDLETDKEGEQLVSEPVETTTVEVIRRVASGRMASADSMKEENKNGKEAGTGRPSTSPARRVCFKNQWATAKLPNYNGLRSEYGLSSEQLQERKKKIMEKAKLERQRKEEIYKEEKRRQKENELMFATWLVKKKKEAALKATRRKQLQSAFYFKTLPAPTRHLEKMGVLRKKVLARREHTCYSLEEFFKSAKPHEQKTYKIYLGLCVE